MPTERIMEQFKKLSPEQQRWVADSIIGHLNSAQEEDDETGIYNLDVF
ncbi:hypothetical protein [Desulforamulus aquiferis]|uniref:Uncharacterized protein n=1 Tax=Desulforamulus aquiferis TaxID=1397668 RepID=A0AAW7ZAC9_9FIRM|nr:hypothetical protein [Desulforamulus aquiferis]MDO7786021.1 hypothetical protein [Desulforamulus aquiferis]RYD04738.1 hypothetical protein N752_12490 [Desulforamulus aquiferis]